MRPVHSRSRLAASLVLALQLSGAAAAQTLVEFTDGRTLEVGQVERQDAMTLLRLEGGGSIAVPSARIANWSELPKPAPAATARRLGQDQLWRRAAGEFAQLIGAAAARHGVDPALLTAVAQVESAFDPSAVSPKGAGGLMQLMPATAQRFGVDDVFDVAQNVEGGTRYLAWLLDRFEGSRELALAGYNAGEGAVDRYGGIPPYRETRSYVTQVLAGAGRLEAPAD